MITELALIWLVVIDTAGIGLGIYGYFAAKRKWVK
jgi:hypothetical protein